MRFRLCESAHGCLHSQDQRVAGESTPHPTADLETVRASITSKRTRDTSLGSRRSVSFTGSYLSTLTEHGVEISVARRGCPWENGYAERLIRTLKEEEVYLNDYDDIHEVRVRIGHFIQQVYHQKRPHSALGYLTPMEFEQQNLA